MLVRWKISSRSPRRLALAGLAAVAMTIGSAGVAYSQESVRDASPAALASPPAPLQPPAGNVLRGVFAARGVQVYQCTSGAWAFLEPAASLIGWTIGGRPARTAIHFRGPSWQSVDDGSLVEAKAIASVPVTGSIPQLLLQATKTRGGGTFGSVTYIQRLSTSGGTAPAGACTDGATTGVPYLAEYRFYVAA